MKDNNFKSAMPITAARRAPAAEKAVKWVVKGTKYGKNRGYGSKS